MSDMTTYEIPVDVAGEMHLAGYGKVAYEFEAGPFVPANAQLAAVLDRLVAAGVVKIAEAKPTIKKKAEPEAAVKDSKE